MNNNPAPYRFGALFILALAFAFLCIVPQSAAQASDALAVASATETASTTPGTITSVNPGLIDSVLAIVADSLVGRYGWAAKLFAALGTVAGILRMVVKPLWAKFVLPGLEQYVASTPEKEDDERLHRFLGHPITKGALFVLDVIGSVKIPTPKRSLG
jgi:hypothetical protein